MSEQTNLPAVTDKPLEVAVAITERETTDKEFDASWRRLGGGKLSAQRVKDLQTLGIHVKRAGTLVGARGQAFLLQSSLWDTMEKIDTALEEVLREGPRSKTKVARLTKLADSKSGVAKTIIESQKVLVEIESRTTGGPANQVPEVQPPQNMGPPPRQTIVMGTEIHLHETNRPG